MDCVDQHIARGSQSQEPDEAGPGEIGTHTLPLAPWCDVTDIVPMQEAQHRVPSMVCRDKDLRATSSKLCYPQDHLRQGIFILSPDPAVPSEGFKKVEDEV